MQLSDFVRMFIGHMPDMNEGWRDGLMRSFMRRHDDPASQELDAASIPKVDNGVLRIHS